MHATDSPQLFPSSRLRLASSRRAAAFSLIEVAMAIGIIAVAFVALFGLVPTGLTTFRAAIDTSNEARIFQSVVSTALATDYNTLKQLDYATGTPSSVVYYYDEEGSLLDTSANPVPSRITERIYASKIFIEQARQANEPTAQMGFAYNMVVVFANLNSPAKKEFDAAESLSALRSNLENRSQLRVRSALLAKMDGQ